MRFTFIVRQLECGLFKATQVRPPRADGGEWAIGPLAADVHDAACACDESVRSFARLAGIPFHTITAVVVFDDGRMPEA